MVKVVEARAELKKVISVNKQQTTHFNINKSTKSARDWNQQGLNQYQSQGYEKALVCFDKAIEIQPNFDIAWNNLGLALYSLKCFQESLAAFERAIELNPNSQVAIKNACAARNRLGR